MYQFVNVKHGFYRTQKIDNQMFELVAEATQHKKGTYVTVIPNDSVDTDLEKIRIRVIDYEYIGEDIPEINTKVSTSSPKRAEKKVETDEEIANRISARFEILDQMTKAAIDGDVRAMIVVGPPGCGKSVGVERQLEIAATFDVMAGKGIKYEVVKGNISPVGLYRTLYEHSDAGHVLVFDDIDDIFNELVSLNLLKAALDSGKRRRINWNTDSSLLRREGIPNNFDFKGSVIFITNDNLDDKQGKKLKGHIEALQSRCHFVDLHMKTNRDKIIRIKQVHNTGDLFAGYNITEDQGNEIIDFMVEKQNDLRELSLRSAIKIAELVKVSQHKWKFLAENTLMKNSY